MRSKQTDLLDLYLNRDRREREALAAAHAAENFRAEIAALCAAIIERVAA